MAMQPLHPRAAHEPAGRTPVAPAMTKILQEEIEQHGARTAWLAEAMARVMGLDNDTVQAVGEAASYHDIGKQYIDEAVLCKSGQLESHERRHMEMHVVFGAWRLMSGERPGPRLASQVALLHHEWWNGGGYPFGLSGREIPLAARITAVADVFDALSQRRCYKPAWPRRDVMAYLHAQRSRQFDPECADAMREVVSGLPADWHRQPVPMPARRLVPPDGVFPPLHAAAQSLADRLGCRA